MKILGILRERIFSPGKVGEDAAILDAVLQILSDTGHQIHARSAEALDGGTYGADLILSMAQSEPVLSLLEKAEDSGIPVVNAAAAVRNCYRKAQIATLSATSIPMPDGRIASIDTLEKDFGSFGKGDYWLKRGDFHALCENDVIRIRTREDLSTALAHFRGQGVDQVLVQAHVAGVCAKFYGVGTTPDSFFKVFLPAAKEEMTSRIEQLGKTARAAAEHTGLEIYGGDAVMTSDGEWVLIDLNDWPTFSLCRKTAAQAIVAHLRCRYAMTGGIQ